MRRIKIWFKQLFCHHDFTAMPESDDCILKLICKKCGKVVKITAKDFDKHLTCGL